MKFSRRLNAAWHALRGRQVVINTTFRGAIEVQPGAYIVGNQNKGPC